MSTTLHNGDNCNSRIQTYTHRQSATCSPTNLISHSHQHHHRIHYLALDAFACFCLLATLSISSGRSALTFQTCRNVLFTARLVSSVDVLCIGWQPKKGHELDFIFYSFFVFIFFYIFCLTQMLSILGKFYSVA